jgi:hypothetical protein
MRCWTLSTIYFGPTGTLLSRGSIPSLFIAGLSLMGMKDRKKMFYNNVKSRAVEGGGTGRYVEVKWGQNKARVQAI